VVSAVITLRLRCTALVLLVVGLAAMCSPGNAVARKEWVIQRLPSSIPQDPFEVRVDGVRVGMAKLLVFANRVDGTRRYPQVLVIAASGYLRIKPGADPVPPLPFGQSLVLGPAVFGTAASFPSQPRLFFNPQVQRVDIDRSRLKRSGKGRLLIRIVANDRKLAASRTETNQIADMSWNLVLREPTNASTRLEVAGRFKFTERVTPDPTRTAEFQSFRLVQVSSMYIDAARHDVDAFRYRGSGGPVEVAFSPEQAGSLLPAAPAPLAPDRQILDMIHTDDVGQPNGNTPSYRIAFRRTSGPFSGPLTPRAFFSGSQDLNDDNLGVWIHQRPSRMIPRGAAGVIAFSVVATEDPPPDLP
jgi:hypothetical protein